MSNIHTKKPFIKSFIQFMNEEDEANETKTTEKYPTSVEDLIQYFIQQTLENVAQFHIYHWLTDNGTHHGALSDFYTGLQTEVDEFVEQAFLKYDIKSMGDFKDNTVLKFQFSLEMLQESLDKYKVVINDLITVLKEVEDTHLVEELSEVQELIKTLEYKLQLS